MERARRIERLFPIVLDNFSLAEHIINYLGTVHAQQLPPPRVTVIMQSDAGDAHVPGTSCGFFTTPVIHQAVVDVRRTLSFFNLRYGYKAGSIEAYVDEKHPNNANILDLGLPSVTPAELLALSQEVIESAPDQILRDILIYTDTQLVHFTKDEHQPDLGNLFKACRLMEEGILRFVYDRAALPRPVIQAKS
jgi:hypothetical protein